MHTYKVRIIKSKLLGVINVSTSMESTEVIHIRETTILCLKVLANRIPPCEVSIGGLRPIKLRSTRD